VIEDKSNSKITKTNTEKSDKIKRQDLLLAPLGVPFMAAALPAAAAAAIGVYGTYQEDIHRIVNSFLGKTYNILFYCT
jgi:small neutral amino acid transporter SnatA (MarC family)